MSQNSTASNLFKASCFALVTTAMTFAIRAKIEEVFITDYHLTNEQIGFAFGPAFWGFTLAMLIGGPLVDYFGMKKILNFAFIGHLLGITITLFARDFWTLFAGTLCIGIGNGMVEAACNPLVASLFPENKTKMLNRFHVWFPGGIVIGSVIGYITIDLLHLHWMFLVGVLFIPLAIYTSMIYGKEFPKTERVKLNVSNKNMLKACLSPLFLFMVFCMFLTAATELGTGQRISSLLGESGIPPLLILAFINGLMVIGRFFAGEIVHRINITLMLLLSTVFSLLGLLLLSYTSGISIFFAAAVFAIGVCYFWPTMLSFVAEKIPESGALGLSLMGGAGMLSVSLVLPIMGNFMDTNITGSETLRLMAILPAILIIAFGTLHIVLKRKS